MAKRVVVVRKKKKKAPPKKKWKPPFTFVEFKTFWIDVWKALKSEDGPTRRMARVFWFCFIGACVSGTWGTGRVLFVREEKPKPVLTAWELEQKRELEEFIEKQKEEAKLRGGTTDLGAFVFHLTPMPGEANVNIHNMAEVRVVVECDRKPTCDYLAAHQNQLRDAVVEAFEGMDRDLLLSIAGKNQLRNALQSKINEWLPNGKVMKVYFVALVIS